VIDLERHSDGGAIAPAETLTKVYAGDSKPVTKLFLFQKH
jgi:hypothetical protein